MSLQKPNYGLYGVYSTSQKYLPIDMAFVASEEVSFCLRTLKLDRRTGAVVRREDGSKGVYSMLSPAPSQLGLEHITVTQTRWPEHMNRVVGLLDSNRIFMCNLESYLTVEG